MPAELKPALSLLLTGVLFAVACDDDDRVATDAGPVDDAGMDASTCTWDTFPGSGRDAARLSREEYCARSLCPSSLSAYQDRYTCYDVLQDGSVDGLNHADAAVDAGLFRWWTRTEGCGSVAFEVMKPSYPRYYHFAADGGALLGAGQQDDAVHPNDCAYAARVMGTIAAPCSDAGVQWCVREPGPN